MKWVNFRITIALLVSLLVSCAVELPTIPGATLTSTASEKISLPAPILDGVMTVERAMQERRSVRDYQKQPLSLTQIGQLLWSAQGITSSNGHRTAPSAGALYPLEIYLVAGEVEGIETGVYKYDPEEHTITQIASGDVRKRLMASALDQSAILDAPASLVFGAVYERTSAKYGERGARYVHMEIGFAAENVYLQAQALDLGTVFIGAFYDDEVKQTIYMQQMEQPLGIMPVGFK